MPNKNPMLLPWGVSGSRFVRRRREAKSRSLLSKNLVSWFWKARKKISGNVWQDSGFAAGFSQHPALDSCGRHWQIHAGSLIRRCASGAWHPKVTQALQRCILLAYTTRLGQHSINLCPYLFFPLFGHINRGTRAKTERERRGTGPWLTLRGRAGKLPLPPGCGGRAHVRRFPASAPRTLPCLPASLPPFLPPAALLPARRRLRSVPAVGAEVGRMATALLR